MKLFLDMPDLRDPAPKPGDVMVSLSKRDEPLTGYMIESVHRVRRRDPRAVRRFTMQVHHVAKEIGLQLAKRLILFHWYPRKRKSFEKSLSEGIKRHDMRASSEGGNVRTL